jgi:MtN3 and saliva related transmembrane protein
MTSGTWKLLIGTVAAFCTTAAFLPQLLKIRRSGGRDLSYAMLFLYLIGVIFWLVYGTMLRATELIVANAVAICLVSACIGMKWRMQRKSRECDSVTRQTALQRISEEGIGVSACGPQ